MRPIYKVGSDNISGSWFRKFPEGRSLDTKLQQTPYPTVSVIAYGAGFGRIPGYGTYIEIAHTKYDTHRFWNTAPQPTLTLRPVLNNPAKVVTNPTTLFKMPGYTDKVNFGSTYLSMLLTKPYLGAPAF